MQNYYGVRPYKKNGEMGEILQMLKERDHCQLPKEIRNCDLTVKTVVVAPYK